MATGLIVRVSVYVSKVLSASNGDSITARDFLESDINIIQSNRFVSIYFRLPKSCF